MIRAKDIAANQDVVHAGSNHVERCWRAIQKVISHDLPNQLIAVQGLLQLLALDEAERLSADGLDIVKRLQATSVRLLEMTHLLKELAKAPGACDQPVMVSLTDLVSEAVTEARQQFPRLNVSLQGFEAVHQVRAVSRSLHQALVLLLKVAVQSAAKEIVRLVIGADRGEGVTTLWLGFAPDRNDGQTIWASRTFDDRLELLLARELMHDWGEVEVGQDPARGKLFVLRVASP